MNKKKDNERAFNPVSDDISSRQERMGLRARIQRHTDNINYLKGYIGGIRQQLEKCLNISDNERKRLESEMLEMQKDLKSSEQIIKETQDQLNKLLNKL